VSRFLSSLTPRFNRRDAEARRRSSRYVILPGDAGFVFFVVNNQKKKEARSAARIHCTAKATIRIRREARIPPRSRLDREPNRASAPLRLCVRMSDPRFLPLPLPPPPNP
jgi:hypothetical protein